MARRTSKTAETIEKDSYVLSKRNNDLDLYRRFYSIRETETDEQILIQFVAPKIIAYEEYRFYLLHHSVVKSLEPSRYYRPDYVSNDEYGTTNLWALLLFINDIPTIEDFTAKEILIPSRLAIAHIGREAVRRGLLTEIVALHELPEKDTPPLFYRKQSIPHYEDRVVEIPEFQPADLYFERETFTVDVTIARQRFVDLTLEPVEESVVLNVSNKPNYVYGKHYIMIRGRKGNNRLTWDPREISSGGIGMVDIMIEDIEFEVQYARKV